MPLNSLFEIEFLDEAREFIKQLSEDEKKVLLKRIEAAKITRNSKYFEKLTKEIWEFRARHNGLQYRIFAFWDKSRKSIVLGTHGYIKKTQKAPLQEIKHAEQIMKNYYANIKNKIQ